MKRALLLFLVIHLNVFAQDADDSVDFTGVMQVMLTALTPSSNTIWEVDYFATEPYDDQTWERISVASDQIASALPLLARDNARWMNYINELQNANNKIRESVELKDMVLFLQGYDEIYYPCEDCHTEFLSY
jgi:ABC-type Na+ transport system ATPase subunit NatA